MTITHPQSDNQTAAAERRSLRTTLEAQQQRVGGVLAGLEDQTLRRSVFPSGWSPLGMMHHLAEMHRFWFRDVLSDEHPYLLDDSGPDFGLDPAVPTDQVLAAYDRETQHALTVIGVLDLDAAPAWWPEELFDEWRLGTQREVILHVVVELSSHSGHLDAVRELIDGRTWSYVMGRVAAPDEREGLM